MNIELIGGQFVNKGAELMTLAARDMVRSWDPAHRVFMPMNAGTRVERARAGIGTVLHLDSNRMPPVARMIRTTSAVVPNVRGLVSESDIDVVLDISGFAYSDSWGPRTAVRRSESYPAWKRRGASIVLMPQAFGPFSSEDLLQAIRSIVSSATLTFARDPVSLLHLEQARVSPEVLRCAPDFTNLLAPSAGSAEIEPPAPVAIVPNVRMLDKTSEGQAEQYIQFLDVCVAHLAATTGCYLLVHESKDHDLAQEVANRAPAPVEIVTDADPLVLKSYLGRSSFVVGSRYHALVSALSEGVPVIAAGWSHKYETLLDEYHIPENLIGVEAPADEIRERLDGVAAAADSPTLLEGLRKAADVQQMRSVKMWEEVRRVAGL